MATGQMRTNAERSAQNYKSCGKLTVAEYANQQIHVMAREPSKPQSIPQITVPLQESQKSGESSEMKQAFYFSHNRRPFGFNPVLLGKKAKAWKIFRAGLGLP